MKAAKKILLVLLTSVLFFGISNTAMAATLKAYQNYVNKQMVPSLGKAKEGTAVKQNLNYDYGGWCQTKGVLSVYASNLDSKKGKEAIVTYLKKSDHAWGKDRKTLNIAILSEKKGKIKINQNIEIDSSVDGGFWCDARVYLKTYNGKKYVVIMFYTGLDECMGQMYVLSMNSAGKLVVKDAIYDCGGATGAYLCRLPMSGALSVLDPEPYYNNRTVLYSSEGESTEPMFGAKLQSELKKFGIKVSLGRTLFGMDTYLIQRNENMKLICYVKASSPRNAKTTYTIFDNTNF